MFGSGSGRGRGVRVDGRRARVLCGTLAAVCVTLLVVRTAASGQTPATATSSSRTAPALRAKLAAGARPRAAAIVGGKTATVGCGQVLTASTTLTADLNCTGNTDGLQLGANGIVLNLNGHFIMAPSGGLQSGVSDLGHSGDTIENGDVIGFGYGVNVTGASNTVTKLQVTAAAAAGIFIGVGGTRDQVTGNTLTENKGTGLVNLGGIGNTVKGNHLLNNGGAGLISQAGATHISGNVANGNASDGIDVTEAPPATLTANTADYNSALGINASSPQIDGGTNAAKGNTTQAQCRGVVCS